MSFKASNPTNPESAGIVSGPQADANTYNMQLKSKHMKCLVTNRGYPSKAKDEGAIRSKYKVQLKKDVFLKFFQILKL